jgi:hypothetical protein
VLASWRLGGRSAKHRGHTRHQVGQAPLKSDLAVTITTGTRLAANRRASDQPLPSGRPMSTSTRSGVAAASHWLVSASDPADSTR